MQDSFEITWNGIPFVNVSRYFFPILVSNCGFEITTLSAMWPKYLHDNIIIFKSTYNINTLTFSRLPLVWPKYPGPYQYSSDNWSGYGKNIYEKSLQLTKLKLCTNNITRCIGIVYLISLRIQDHQGNTLIKSGTILQIQLYTKYNNTQNNSDLQTKPEQSTRPANMHSSICLHPFMTQ